MILCTGKQQECLQQDQKTEKGNGTEIGTVHGGVVMCGKSKTILTATKTYVKNS
jgi:hypothetical protein